MLVRILADNPGRSFTKNLDVKFVVTVKELLRDGQDMSVQQILRETLESFETQKADNETLAPLREMWKKEKAKMEKGGNVVSATYQFQRNFNLKIHSYSNRNRNKLCRAPSTRRHSTLISKITLRETINLGVSPHLTN